MNRRKRDGGHRKIVAVLVTIILLVVAFAGLELLKKHASQTQTAGGGSGQIRQQMPVRPPLPSGVQKPYSSSAVRAAIPPSATAMAREERRAKRQGQGIVAIIVDDMGNSMEEANSLLNINLPLTFSIIPGLPKAKAVATAAHGKGREVMVHIPMEPKEYEKKPFEKNGLLLRQSDEEIVRRLNDYFLTVPYAVGANNHMGSRFTEDRGKMGTVLGVLKGKGMFFIDSKTTPGSVGDKLAREMGVETAARSVFLDNVQDVAAIRKQLDQVADAARKHGSAIAICHPHRATIQALAVTMPELQKKGITFVYASEIVR